MDRAAYPVSGLKSADALNLITMVPLMAAERHRQAIPD
jgi:hypothetical protein